MNSIIKFNRPLTNILVLVLLGFMVPATVLADSYRVIIKRVATDATTGDVIIRIKPGKNEDDFSGTADVMLVGTDIGTNRGLATLLTAVSVGAEMIIDVPNPPSSNDIQAVTSLSLIAP